MKDCGMSGKESGNSGKAGGRQQEAKIGTGDRAYDGLFISN